MDFAEIIKIGPLLTGGLAGSLFTYLFSGKYYKKNLIKLYKKESTTHYSLEGRGQFTNELKVSYDKKEYDKLSYFESVIENISTNKVLDDSSFVFDFGKKSKILDMQFEQTPIPYSYESDKNGILENATHIHRFKFGSLKPGGKIIARFVLNDADYFNTHYDGKQETNISSTIDNNDSNITLKYFPIIGYILMLIFVISYTSLDFYQRLLSINEFTDPKVAFIDFYKQMSLYFLIILAFTSIFSWISSIINKIDKKDNLPISINNFNDLVTAMTTNKYITQNLWKNNETSDKINKTFSTGQECKEEGIYELINPHKEKAKFFPGEVFPPSKEGKAGIWELIKEK